MSESQIEITKDLTIPKLFLRQCRKYGKSKVAMREKEFGIWRPFTWQDYYENVKYFSLGMVSLGLKKGDKVAMIGDNRPEGLWAEMAALCAGGVGVWLFQDCMMEEVKYIIDHSDAKFFVGETQQEVDKALSIKDECPKLERILWDDPKGMRNYHQDFFGRSLNISLPDGTPAHTGCVAFGLERFAFAFLAQYGFDLSNWPEEVRTFLESRNGQLQKKQRKIS